MGAFLRVFVVAACLLALTPPAAAQVPQVCHSLSPMDARTCGEGDPYVHTWTNQGLMDGNVTACTGASEESCWEGGPRVGATFAWTASNSSNVTAASRACVEVPYPVRIEPPIGAPFVWDSTKGTICINDGKVSFNGCPPLPDGPKRLGPEWT